MSKEDLNKKVSFQQTKTNEPLPKKFQTVTYKPVFVARQFVQQAYNECTARLKVFTLNDPQINRKDTAAGLNQILDSLQFAIKHLNIGTFEDKQQSYYLTYNGVLMILEICQLLRTSQFSSLTIDHLGFAICSLECNLVLLNIKFLEIRIKLYVELSHVYGEVGSNDVSLRTIELAVKKTIELQTILEQDPPLPNYTQKIFEGVFRILRILEIKFKLQINQLPGDAFKKKLEEYFSLDKEGRVAAIIESLKFRTFNYVEQNGKALAWKEPALKQAFEIIKPEIEIIVNYIKQQLGKIERAPVTDQNEEARIKAFNEKMNAVQITDSRFKEATRCLPLEYHIELSMHAYDVGNMGIFEDLSQSAFTRSKYRRIEMPYITDIDIVVSEQPNPNIKNGYEKIDFDINEAQLKILMKKNRIFKDDGPQQQQQDNKGGKDTKKPGKDVKQEVKVEEKDTKFQEAIPGIKHRYTYITIKRSMAPEYAICDFQLVLAPEGDQNSPEIKPFMDQGYNVQECPVQQYAGVREAQKKTIFFCFKCTKEQLKNEEEKKTLLLDIKPIFSKSPLARPDFGYQKIDIDLRQTPSDFIKHPDNDYVYISFKSNEHFYSNERMLKLMMNLYELEKSFGKDKISTVTEQRQIELDINFDIKKLQQIFMTIKESLEGPLGVQFYQDRKEFMIKLNFYLWKKYIVSQLYQIESIQDMALQEEITSEELAQFMVHIDPLKQIYKTGLKMINLILVRDPTRSIIWFIKSTMELTKILMQDEENHEASQFLKTCYDMVVQYRDEQLSRGVESRKDLFIPYSITANNPKIGDMINQVINSYVSFKNELGCVTREKQRIRELKPLLVREEQEDELQEILDFNLLNNDDNNRDKKYFEHFSQENFIPQLDLTINALQVDLITCYYRCLIKNGKKMEKIHKNTDKNNEFTSEIFQKKLDMSKGKSFQETKKKLNTLQNDLQNAGRLPVPQPQIKDYEKRLKNHALKNPYLLAILNMLIAGNKKQYAEQKYLLNQSLEYIQQASEMEKQMTDSAIRDAVYTCSTLLDNKIIDQKSGQFPPFDKLFVQEYIVETEQPRTPIYISRTSTSITLKLPPFNPLVNEMDQLSDPGCKDIRSMVLYGKVAANGVNVSTTCTDLQNTGTRNEVGSVLQIRQLLNNEGYCFAVAGFNVNEKQSKKVGETSQPIITLQPMPINQLYAYLAKQAYWIGDFEVAAQAAKKNIEFFIEKSEIQDRFLDQENQVLFYRIKQSTLRDVSNLEIISFAESLFIKARCMQKIWKQDLMINRHKNLCLQANYSLMALEACSVTSQMVLGKRVLIDLYNNIGEIVKIKSRYLFQILIKMFIFMQDIPKQYWDNQLRQLSAKLIYEISVVTFQFNQINLGKLVIYQSGMVPNRKYKITPKVIEVAEENIQAKGGAPAKVAKAQTVQATTDEVKMVQKLIYTLSEQPSYQDFLEDSLLNFTEEYGDLVSGFLENWKEQLDYYSQYIENGVEKVEQLKTQLQLKWSFWEILKEPQTALQKIMTTMKQYPSYVEMLCKFARRQIENNNLKSAKEILAQVEPLVSENIQTLNKIFQLKFVCTKKDIAWNPQSLETLKMEKESNGELENQAIQIFTEYYQLQEGLVIDQNQTLWRAEFYYLKALTTYLDKGLPIRDSTTDVYFENERLDLEKIIDGIKVVNELNTRNLNQQEQEFFRDLQSILAQASFFAVESNAEFQLKNIVKFAQNICIREQMNPFDLRGSEANLYSLMIAENMLKIFKKQVQPQENLIQQLTKDFWFNRAEMQPYADFASFIINALLIEEKYSVLSNFCKNFCNTTQHYYSNIVIPFMIYAQRVQEEKASLLTQERTLFLTEKTAKYEEWKNGKRRKNRVAQMTGEVPQEELLYNQEKEVITHQITILQKKQDSITEKKKMAQQILNEINRDANQAQVHLFQCKRGLEKFADMIKNSSTDQIQKNTNNKTYEYLKKSYKSVIELLTKRKDIPGLIRALSQMGDLQFSQGQVNEAEENWNDALDNIFQKIHSLKQQSSLQYDKISEGNCLSACVFLYKLAKNCYFSNLYLQKETFIMAATLSFQVYKTQMVNPQTLIGFADTRTILLPIDLFNQNLEPIITMQSLDFLIQGLIDNEMHIKALPLIQIMDYIACKVCFTDYYSTRSKLFKSIVLSKIGMINQSYQILLQVQSEKSGPIPLLQQNENLSISKGANWYAQSKEFINSAQYFQEQNKEAIETIQKLEVSTQFDSKHSILNNFLFQYAKIQLLFSIHELEVIDRPEFAELRINVIKNLEIKTRELLLLIQKSEDSNLNDFTNQGPLGNKEAKEERLGLIYKARFLIANMLIAIGSNTRAYFVLKTGMDVIQNHVFELSNAEPGKEPENEDLTSIVNAKDNKDNKKGGKPEVKDLKKGGKAVEEVKVVEEKKFEYNYETLQNKKKRKHLNGFWYNKFKISIAYIFFSQNRFENCLVLLQKIKKDSLLINDKFTIKLAEELEAKVFIRQGKVTEGINKLLECVQQVNINDYNIGRLQGDLGELLYEQQQYVQALQLFQSASHVYQAQKIEYKFDFQPPINKKPEQEKTKINDKFVFPPDIMEQLSKKETKIRKDDKKGGKEAPKKDAKGKGPAETQELKILAINPFQSQDILQIQKAQLKEYVMESPMQLSIYIRFLEDYIRVNLRLLKCQLALDQLEDLEVNFQKLEFYISGNFNLPLSFKVEFYFLQGLTYKRLFVNELQRVSKHYIDQYKQQQNKKYRKLHDRQPVRDLPRNKYLLDLPNFSHNLKQTLIPSYLEKSKKIFKATIQIIKGECIFYEGDVKIDQILMEMADLALLQREYMPRFGFKYIQQEEDLKLQELEKQEKIDKLNLEYECSQIITYAINIMGCKKEILQTSLGAVNVPDPTKIPADLVAEILESDFIYKKKYEQILFDETKNKKTVVNSLDLVYLLNKLQRESKIMTFSGNKAQKTILKIHRFLKTFHTQYTAKCTMSEFEIKSKQDLSSPFIEDGKFWFKQIACEVQKEYKFVYVLSRYTKSKLVAKISREEIDKLLNIEDKEVYPLYYQVLYGNFYVSSKDLSNLELLSHNLRSKFLDSELKEKSVKERDMKNLVKKFLEIFDFLGKLFNKKNTSDIKKGSSVEYDILQDKYLDFVPPLNLQNIDIFVKMFGPEGVEADINNSNNHNLLVLLRNYHKSKYR